MDLTDAIDGVDLGRALRRTGDGHHRDAHRDESWTSSRTSGALAVEEETLVGIVRSVLGTTRADGFLDEEAAESSRALAATSSAVMPSILEMKDARYHIVCSLADMASHSGGKSAGMASSP